MFLPEKNSRFYSDLLTLLSKLPTLVCGIVCLNKALNHLLNIPDEGSENSEALNLAVDVIGAANDVKLTTHLTNYLLGDVDGTPKVVYSMNSIIVIIIIIIMAAIFCGWEGN